MVYQRQDQRSTQIIYNGKNINNGIPMPRPTINSKLSTTEKNINNGIPTPRPTINSKLSTTEKI